MTGPEFRQTRQALRYGITALSRLLNVSRQTIGNWERSDKPPLLAQAALYAVEHGWKPEAAE